MSRVDDIYVTKLVTDLAWHCLCLMFIYALLAFLLMITEVRDWQACPRKGHIANFSILVGHV